ncbi:MAG: type II toxin-antitoxin system YafQ family toxin [Candidatus Scalindua sp.]|nr:type II toxin-antitoxin system YafQ family toxin [Candidatus Scalindua sp.]
MYKIRASARFRRDVRRCNRQRKDMQLFKDIDALLVAGKLLPQKNKDHFLAGNWRGHRECHIAPDWLLIYKVNEDEKVIEYVRTGSHSELFG